MTAEAMWPDWLRHHVIPLDDLRQHEATMNCWCQPDDDGLIVQHHAADGREAYETGERKVN